MIHRIQDRLFMRLIFRKPNRLIPTTADPVNDIESPR